MNKIKIKEYPYVIKDLSPGGCGNDAYYITHIPKSGIFIHAKDLLHIDGSPVKRHEVRACSSCGKTIYLKAAYIFDRRTEFEHYFLTRDINWKF